MIQSWEIGIRDRHLDGQRWINTTLQQSWGCNFKYVIKKELECFRKPENQHSEHVVSVHLRKTNQRLKVIGHIPVVLSKVIHGLLSVSVIAQLLQ